MMSLNATFLEYSWKTPGGIVEVGGFKNMAAVLADYRNSLFGMGREVGLGTILSSFGKESFENAPLTL